MLKFCNLELPLEFCQPIFTAYKILNQIPLNVQGFMWEAVMCLFKGFKSLYIGVKPT